MTDPTERLEALRNDVIATHAAYLGDIDSKTLRTAYVAALEAYRSGLINEGGLNRRLATLGDTLNIALGHITVAGVNAEEFDAEVSTTGPTWTQDQLENLFVHHQRQGTIGGCHCGAVRLGESYTNHLAALVLAGPR